MIYILILSFKIQFIYKVTQLICRTVRWQKTALLQAEASACVSGLANVLFCGLAVSFFSFSHCKINTVVSFFGLLVTIECSSSKGLRATFLSTDTKFYAGQNV